MIILYFICLIAIPEITIAEQTYFNQHFSNIQFSVREFYKIIEELIDEKYIPGVKMFYIFESQGGLFSAKRQYLRVVHKQICIQIAAIPYGNGIMVTCRRGALANINQKLFDSSSATYKFFDDLFFKETFYKADRDRMAVSMINDCIKEAIQIGIDGRFNRFTL